MSRAARKAETSARLIAAARQAFREQGYAAASMDAICAAAGVTRGALYHNFGGKEGLFEAVARCINAEILDRLAIVAGARVDLDRFVACCVAYLNCARDPETQRILFRDGPAVLGERLRDIDKDGALGPLTEAIAALQTAGVLRAADPQALAVQINGGLVDAALWIAAEPDPDAAFAASAVAAEALIHGLAQR